tara:strand:+ start:201 stop:467 length:267 start_codon:yes stop_codon:yes gene_type:complete
MFRIFAIMCMVNQLGATECSTHHRDDFHTWPTHEQCTPFAEAALEETLNTFKIMKTDYVSIQVGCEPVTQEQLDREIKEFEDENDDEI